MILSDYQALLARIGYETETLDVSAGRLLLRRANLNYILEHNNENDPYYFRFVLPNVVDTSDGINVIEDIVNTFNVTFKVTKIIHQGTQYHIVAEQYVFDYTTLEPLINRVISIMSEELNQFHQQLILLNNGNSERR